MHLWEACENSDQVNLMSITWRKAGETSSALLQAPII